MARKGVTITNSGLFSTSTVSDFSAPGGRTSFDGLASLSGSITTGSSVFEDFSSALKSTQQIPIDWSKFEKHTFFDSAESKINVAFDTIINFYPFDSPESERAEYIQGLTGFEKYIYDTLWPKHKGYLHFSGTQKGEDPSAGHAPNLGSHISIVDQAGNLYPTISKRSDAAPIIDFSSSPFTCAFHLNLPPQANDNATIIQKLTQSHGFSLFISESASLTEASVVFAISSGSTAISASVAFEKSSTDFHHCAAVLTRRINENPGLLIYKDGRLLATSSQTANIGQLNFKTANILIGSGSSHNLGTYSTTFDAITTFSGSLDDLRLYKTEKNITQIKNIASGTYGHVPDLLAYYKFNEATGSYDNNEIVLDHSGNSLHGSITNYTSSLRVKGDLVDPMPNEDIDNNPVLFPSFPKLVALNRNLLLTASNYDANNPNLITKMIPRHYLEEEAYTMGYPNARAGLGEEYSYTSDFPGGGDPGSPQLIASLLFMWAKFFDEIKLFIDHFGSLLKIDYDDPGTVADVMLPFFAKYYGIALPNMFSDATAEQYLKGQNVLLDAQKSDMSLAKIQATIWRRILINIQDSIRSKGTIHGIKSVMRATGINPDTMFRFRESGGPRELSITDSRIFRNETSSMLHFASSSILVSKFLSGSRVEPGLPIISTEGTMVEKTVTSPHGISNWKWDGLFTSGSWTTEFITKQNPPKLITSASISRMCSTGSLGLTMLSNCIAVGASKKTTSTGSLTLFHNPVGISGISPLELHLTGTDIFDGGIWHISYGREVQQDMTASYFLRAGRQSNGTLTEYKSVSTTASFGVEDLYSSGSTQANVSGSFMQFGTSQFDTFSAGLNNAAVTSHAKVSTCTGSVGRIRFWSKALTPAETKEHIRNFKSVGVEDPLLNFNFVVNSSGSFERMRFDAQCDQITTSSDTLGNVDIFDYSQNNFHMSGTLFPAAKEIIKPQDFRFSSLNTKFDERSTTNKIRIAGFLADENIEMFNTLKSPVRTIPLGTPVEDDTRFSIEISSCKALNDDIILLLGTLDFFNDALGSPELMFAQDYPNIIALRQVYFNRLTGKINYKNLVSFYKWVDDTIGFLINRMIPSNTSFHGMNFVIESHMLERSKLRYLQEDIYLGENDRRGLQTDLNLQQVVGQLKRF